jgi:hypothetical protein
MYLDTHPSTEGRDMKGKHYVQVLAKGVRDFGYAAGLRNITTGTISN